MNKKLERELNGPSMTEVLLGAALSLLLGVALAAAYLIFTPVETVKELPKEPVRGVVYYLEGSRDASKARQAAAKQKTLLEGGSVTLIEDELNAMTGPAPTVAPPAPGKKPAAAPEPAPASSGKAIAAGVPNFRLRDSVLQIGVPLHVSVFGIEPKVIFQARGGFEKKGETFAFVPSELYLGSCPLHRLPGVERAVLTRLLAAAPAPAELSALWSKLTDIAAEGSNLRVATQ